MVYYYKKKLPSVDDIVIAKVEKISELGVEVSLTEYNGIRGFINCGEVSRKKRVNLNKLLTVGKDILLNVIQVDEIKQFVDLSKRTISDEDIKLFGEKHKLHIQLYNIFKHIFMKFKNIDRPDNINDTELHNFMCGSLFSIQAEFENEYISEKILSKETNLEILNSINFSELEYLIGLDKIKNILDDYIENKVNRIKPEKTETIKLMTYSSTGLADLKYTLDYKSFEELKDLTNDFDVGINYITGSVYSIIIKQKEFDLGGSIQIEDALSLIKKEIKKRAIEKQIQNQIIV
jgi:translation initiation factor 2 alpha subunit (eIF-2alpha)